ncbi:hypothetical protein ONZ43_g4918 [Nemania bipapillata]|uniref:Uncharacterized protein n=1 Tax=Nemania bipapillata TaxID=110536 RepID=A0ACC2IGZ8_9PEZI|nr:hypothetical protein ONZ43_g4918 [Nemania bipapillata]
MEKEHNFTASVKQWYYVNTHSDPLACVRYQLGEKWEWKKYNQGGNKPSLIPKNKRRIYGISGNPQEEFDNAMLNTPNFLSQNSLVLQEKVVELFVTNQGFHKPLCIRKGRCDFATHLGNCLLWCQERVHSSDAQLPAPYTAPGEGEDVADFHDCTIQIFIYLLNCYTFPGPASQHADWDQVTQIIDLSAGEILYTMSSLIVTIASGVVSGGSDGMRSPVPETEFEVAKLGIDAVIPSVEGKGGWEDTKLVEEFCKEYNENRKDSNAICYAVKTRFIPHTLPNIPDGNFQGIEDEEYVVSLGGSCQYGYDLGQWNSLG